MDLFAFPSLEGETVTAGAAPPVDQEALIAEAAARAREEGIAEGYERAKAELEPVQAALAGAAEALGRAADAVVDEVERRAVDLALALAEKVVHAAVEADPELVCSVVHGALRRVHERDRVVLEVNPADVETVRAGIGAIEAELGGFGRLEVTGERRVAPGGCVVRTLEGEIDAGVDEQLARAAELLRDR